MPIIDAPVCKRLPQVDIATEIVLLTRPEQNPTGYQPFARASEFRFEPHADLQTQQVRRVNAWWLADAAWLSYSHSDDAISHAYKTATGLDAELVSTGGTEFTFATDGAFAIVAFRGTQ